MVVSPATWGVLRFVAAWAALGLFALYRMRVRAPVPMHRQEKFVPMEQTSPAALEMHPQAVREKAPPRAASEQSREQRREAEEAEEAHHVGDGGEDDGAGLGRVLPEQGEDQGDRRS